MTHERQTIRSQIEAIIEGLSGVTLFDNPDEVMDTSDPPAVCVWLENDETTFAREGQKLREADLKFKCSQKTMATLEDLIKQVEDELDANAEKWHILILRGTDFDEPNTEGQLLYSAELTYDLKYSYPAL